MCRSRTDVCAQRPGVGDSIPYIVGGTLLMQGVYRTVVKSIESSDALVWKLLPPIRPDLCIQNDITNNNNNNNNNSNCIRPDMLAFSVVSLLTFLICSILAFYGWHVSGCKNMTKNASAETRLYGYLPVAKWLTIVNLVYQIWDFGISLFIPEYCTPVMMTHHVIAAIVAFSGLYCQMLSFYAIFFMGLSEVSSIWLVVCNLGQAFPPVPGTTFETLQNAVFAPLFVSTFLYYRVFLWWYPASYFLFKDVRTVLRNGQAEKLRPGTSWNLYLMLLLDIPMGFLQLYWAVDILNRLAVLILGE